MQILRCNSLSVFSSKKRNRCARWGCRRRGALPAVREGLSTIRDANCILFMEQGNIIEQGTHKELLAKGGAYAALYNSQFA